MVDIYDHEAQTREAFARVKQDIYELQDSIDNARIRLESITASFAQYPDKKEFYEFVEAAKEELDSLEKALLSRIQKAESAFESKQKNIENNLNNRNKALGDSISSMQKRVKELESSLASKEEVRKASESAKAEVAKLRDNLKNSEQAYSKIFNVVNKRVDSSREASREELRSFKNTQAAVSTEMLLRLKKLEGGSERMRGEIKDLRRQLKLKERQLAGIETEKSAAPGKFPWKFLAFVALLVIVVAGAFYLFPSINLTGENTSNKSVDVKVKDDQCMVNFECKEYSPGEFYSNCAFDTTLDNCRCETVNDVANCNAAERDLAKQRLLGANSKFGGLGIVTLILSVLALTLIVLWWVGRNKPASRGK